MSNRWSIWLHFGQANPESVALAQKAYRQTISHAASGKVVVGGARVSDILQRAISGGALSVDDIARIRLSTLSPIGTNDVAREPAEQPQLLRLDLLRSGGRILALRRGAEGLAARLLSARKARLATADPALVTTLADFILEEDGTPWVGFRNLEPGATHDSGAHLSLALDDARAAMRKFAEQDWGTAILDFVRGVTGAEDLARIPLDSLNQTRVASDRADVDVGWSFVLG